MWMCGAPYGYAGGFPCRRAYILKGDMQIQGAGGNASFAGLDQTAALTTTYDPVTVTGDVATKKLMVKLNRIPAATHNAATGIKSILFCYNQGDTDQSTFCGDFQITVPGLWYPHSSILAETVGTGDGVILDFKTYFPFLKNDASFVLKKNGAIVVPADYSVDYGEPNGDDILPHIKVLEYTTSAANPGALMTYVANEALAAEMNEYVIFENPYFAKYGINYVNVTNASLVASNDSAAGPWSTPPIVYGGTVPALIQKYRYWKLTSDDGFPHLDKLTSAELAAATNIHFAAGKAPLEGDVITADYRCEVIAKTVNNVFDLTVEITLQEKMV